MEAAAAVEFSPGFKFEPNDEELVVCYLLPRLRGHPVPFGGVLVLNDDPRSAQPSDLLQRHCRTDEAFFFTSSEAKYRKGHRQDRGCAGGGTWKGQKNVDGEPLCVDGVEIEWRKYLLNFHPEGGKGSTGWVMHEYSITAPADLASSQWKLCRVRRGAYCQKRKRETQDSSDDEGEARGAPRRAFAAPFLLEDSPLSEEDHGAAVSECSAMPETSTSDQEASAADASECIVMPEATSTSDQDASVMAQIFEDLEPLKGWKEMPASFDSFVVPAETSTSCQDAGAALPFDDMDLPEGWEGMFGALNSFVVPEPFDTGA